MGEKRQKREEKKPKQVKPKANASNPSVKPPEEKKKNY